MDFAGVKTYLKNIVNRTDFTDTLAAQFIQQAQDRLERWPQVDPLKYAPRPSFMQKFVSFTLDSTSDEPGAFTVPNDFLQLVSLYTGEREVERVDMGRFIKYPSTGEGIPTVFIQTGHTIRMRPVPSDDTDVYMLYFGTAKELVVETDDNEWTVAAVDALVYGAATYAADHFEDDRLDRFEMRFKEALLELQDQTINEELSGPMSIGPSYDFQDD